MKWTNKDSSVYSDIISVRGFDIYPIHKRLQRYLGNLDIGTVRPKQGSSDGQRKTSKIIILHFFS